MKNKEYGTEKKNRNKEKKKLYPDTDTTTNKNIFFECETVKNNNDMSLCHHQ